MTQIPANLRYTSSHEWLRQEEDGTVLIGITDYAQSSLGDITFVQLPRVGDKILTGAVFGVVESVKAASDLYAPISGTVIAVNETLNNAPEELNNAPYESGWLLRLANVNGAVKALTAEEYRRVIG